MEQSVADDQCARTSILTWMSWTWCCKASTLCYNGKRKPFTYGQTLHACTTGYRTPCPESPECILRRPQKCWLDVGLPPWEKCPQNMSWISIRGLSTSLMTIEPINSLGCRGDSWKKSASWWNPKKLCVLWLKMLLEYRPSINQADTLAWIERCILRS